MSIYKPKNSPFYHYDFRCRGIRFCGSTGTGDRRKAERVEADARQEAVRTAARVTEAKGKPMTWGMAAARFQDEVGQHYRGAGNAKTALRNLTWLTREIGFDTALTALSGASVARLVARRRGQGVKPATVNRTVTEVIRKVLRRADEAWECTVPKINWWQHMLGEPRPIVREITPEDEAAIMEAERDDYATAMRFAILSGCRRAEIVGLTWANVDFGNRIIHVTGKGEKDGIIPMTTELRELLWGLRGHHPESVFTYLCKRGSKDRTIGKRYPITLEGFKSRWRRTKAKAGVSARFHDTRHTFATRVLRGSGNFRAVQQLLRHSDPKTTAKYAHVLADDLREAMQSARVKSGAEIPETITEINEPVLKKSLRQKDNLK